MVIASRFRRKSHVGRLRREAAELLSEHFSASIDAEDIEPARGFWRMADVYRFEFCVWKPGLQRFSYYGCWQSLTEFVRDAKRFGIDHDDTDVWAKEQ